MFDIWIEQKAVTVNCIFLFVFLVTTMATSEKYLKQQYIYMNICTEFAGNRWSLPPYWSPVLKKPPQKPAPLQFPHNISFLPLKLKKKKNIL
jgi:hypothetical protein